MKKYLIVFTAIITFCMTACSQKKSNNDMENKTAVVYFSATGTTKNIAEQIAASAKADLIEIQPEKTYSSADLDWTDKQSRSSVEMNNPDSRPAVKAATKPLSDYDVVFLGYPIWWDLAPRVVNTFIEANGLDGKRVIPFATSGGSGISNSVETLKREYPAIKWEEGKLINRGSEGTIDRWIDSLNV